jgi:hypothetical protein
MRITTELSWGKHRFRELSSLERISQRQTLTEPVGVGRTCFLAKRPWLGGEGPNKWD